jgi:ACS family tartrate transporter-like MFS transporter
MSQDEALERATVGKIAWRLLPLIGAGYLISFMDRVNIGFAAPQMNAELGFTASVYGFGGGLFFVSYALLEIPSNLVLARVGARRWLARIMITWGLVAMGMALVRTPWQFYLGRFLLGAAEAGFFPGVIYYLGLWFPVAHRARAISRFYVAAPLASLVMGALAGALLGLDGHLSLRGWQWLLILEGAPAVVLAFAYLRWLPDRPDEATWLTAEQKAWLNTRLGAEAAQATAPDHHVVRALVRPPVLALTAVNFLYLGWYYAFTLSAPTVLAGATGRSLTEVGYLTAAGGITGAIGMLANGWLTDRRGDPLLMTAIPLLLVAGGFTVIALARPPAVIEGAYLATMCAYFAVGAAIWLTPAGVIHPRVMAVSIAAANGLGQLGSFVFPWLWGVLKDATGSYSLGLRLLPLPFALAGLIMLALRQARRRRVAAAPA